MILLILIGLSAARFWSCSQSAARFWSCSQSSAFCSGVLVQVLVVGTFTQKLLVPCSVTELRTSRRSRAGDRSRGSATTVNLTAMRSRLRGGPGPRRPGTQALAGQNRPFQAPGQLPARIVAQGFPTRPQIARGTRAQRRQQNSSRGDAGEKRIEHRTTNARPRGPHEPQREATGVGAR